MWYDPKLSELYLEQCSSLSWRNILKENTLMDMLENFWTDKNAPKILQKYLLEGQETEMLSYRELKKLSELADTHEAYKEVFDFYMDEYRFDPEVLQLTQELMEEKKKLNGGNKPWLEVSKKNT